MYLLFQELVNGIVAGAVYVSVAMGLSLIFGVLRVANFAHGEFYMIGAFATFIGTTSLHINYFAAVAVAAGVGLMLGLAAEQIVIRPLRKAPEDAIFLSTFGLSLFMVYGVQSWLGAQSHVVESPLLSNLTVGDVSVTYQQLFVIGLTAGVVVALFALLRWTRFGLAVRAVAQDLETAGLMAVDANLVYRVTFAAAAGIAALAGAAIVPSVTVNPFSGQELVIKAYIIVVIAGMGSLPGAVILSMGMGVVEALASGFLPPGSREIVSFAAVVVVLLLRPHGLFPSTQDAT